MLQRKPSLFFDRLPFTSTKTWLPEAEGSAAKHVAQMKYGKEGEAHARPEPVNSPFHPLQHRL